MGYYRLYLSLLVVASHLWEVTLFKVGAQAVACFFVLSGFLMSRSIEVTYGRTLKGITRYLLNRFLRIYPIYWLILALSALFLILYPNDAFNLQMRLSADPYIIFSNISLFNLYSVQNVFVPPAWSLAVEFIFYIVIGIIPLSFGKSIFGILFSILLLILLWISNQIQNMNTVLVYGLLCFSSGCAVDYFNYSISKMFFFCTVLIIPFLYYIFFQLNIDIYPTIYISGCCAGIICTIYLKQNQKKYAGKFEKICGELSYPVFLCHYFVAEIVNKVIGKFHIPIAPYSFIFFLVSLIFTLLMSIYIYIYIEQHIKILRTHVRGTPAFSDKVVSKKD